MPPHPSLSRTQVVGAAVALADAEGLEALTMRRLAQDLGVATMTVYQYVHDREDLLDAMVGHLIAEFTPDPPPADADWRTLANSAVLAARDSIRRHPWARRAIETRTRRTPAVLSHMERLTQILLRAGFGPDLAHHAMHALGNRIWGFSPEMFDDSQTSARAGEQPDPRDYPGILAIAADAAARRPGATACDEDFEFRFALDVILTGVERLHDAGWQSSEAPSSD